MKWDERQPAEGLEQAKQHVALSVAMRLNSYRCLVNTGGAMNARSTSERP